MFAEQISPEYSMISLSAIHFGRVRRVISVMKGIYGEIAQITRIGN